VVGQQITEATVDTADQPPSPVSRSCSADCHPRLDHLLGLLVRDAVLQDAQQRISPDVLDRQPLTSEPVQQEFVTAEVISLDRAARQPFHLRAQGSPTGSLQSAQGVGQIAVEGDAPPVDARVNLDDVGLGAAADDVVTASNRTSATL
jgi:hypothetical protein